MSSTVHDVVPFEGRFPSWEAFDVTRKVHCEKTYTMYVCRNTVKVAVANKRRKLQVPETWVYDRKIYVCTHGYKRVSRSSGSRPRQNARYTDCKARFTACVVSELSEDGREIFFIKVTGQHLCHSNHPVTLEQWRMYSQNRAAVMEHPYLTHEAELMRRIGSNKRAAREHIETLTGKVCTMKDMHNLYARLKKREKNSHEVDATSSQPQQETTRNSLEIGSSQSSAHTFNNEPNSARVEPILQQFVDTDVDNHVSILSGDDGSNEGICLANRAMKEHFQVFPELMILDISMVSQSDVAGQQLHGFLSMDALGNAKPVFLVRSMPMLSSLLRRVCQDFKRTHPKWRQIKVLAMNKLLPDALPVLATEFPAARVLLCQFHVLQCLNEILAHSQLPERIQATDYRTGITGSTNFEQNNMIGSLQQLVFSNSELRYNEAKNLLAQQLTSGDRKDLLAVFDTIWEPYRTLWTSYARTEQFDLSCFFTKGMKSFWEPMQTAFKRTRDGDLPAGVRTSVCRTSGLSTTVSSQPPMLKVLGIDTQSRSKPFNESNTIPLTFHGVDLTKNTNDNLLAKCTSEILTMVKFVECEWTPKMLLLELTKPVAVDRCDPLLHLMINCLSGFAVDLIISQHTIQSLHASGSVAITKTNRGSKAISGNNRSESSKTSTSPGLPVGEATVRWLNKSTREKQILQRDGSACSCEFFALYQLPCRHLIWYEVVTLQLKQLSLAAVAPRWFLRSFQVPKLDSRRESNDIEYHLL